MKRLTICVSLVIAFAVIVDIERSAAGNHWNLIHEGMADVEVRSTLGKPSIDVMKSKGIQIWINEGLIRSTSLVVFYNDPARPSVVTQTHQGTQWIWERL